MPAIRMRSALPKDDKKNTTDRDLQAGQDLTDLEPEVADKLVKSGLADYLDEKGNIAQDNKSQQKANADMAKDREAQAKEAAKAPTTRVQVTSPPPPQTQPTTLGAPGGEPVDKNAEKAAKGNK